MLGERPDAAALARSYLDWWSLCGLDAVAGEAVTDWRADADATPARPFAAPGAAARTAAPVALDRPSPEVLARLPADLVALQAALTDDGLPGCGHGRRIAPAGSAGAQTMVIGDCPAMADLSAGEPFTGAEGRLIAAMLRAIGRDPDLLYRAQLCASRPASGQVDPAQLAALAGLMRHHVALVRPQVLILFGATAARALLDLDLRSARGRLHILNHGDHSVPVIVTHHPRTLLGRPECKREAWADLKLLPEPANS